MSRHLDIEEDTRSNNPRDTLSPGGVARKNRERSPSHAYGNHSVGTSSMNTSIQNDGYGDSVLATPASSIQPTPQNRRARAKSPFAQLVFDNPEGTGEEEIVDEANGHPTPSHSTSRSASKRPETLNFTSSRRNTRKATMIFEIDDFENVPFGEEYQTSEQDDQIQGKRAGGDINDRRDSLLSTESKKAQF